MEFDQPITDAHASAHTPARHEYRSTQPVLMSSSPGRDQDDQFQSPVTPPSSPPQSPSTRLFRATTASDPFSAAAKGDAGQHPQFGKQFPHAKHPGRLRAKRSLPASPGSPAPAAASSSQGSRVPWSVNHNRALAGRSRVAAHPDASESSGAEGSATETRRDRVLHNFFELSDDAPTSDDHLEAAPWEQSGSDADTSHASVGLGLGASFQEQGSPTSARRFYSRGIPPSSATPSNRSSSFSRTSSVSDPFGALGSAGSLLHAHDHRPTLNGAPSPRQPASQRRRLTGTSPKKPLASTPNRGAWGDSSDDDDDVGMLAPPFGSQGSPSRPTISQLWHKVIDTVFDSGETSIDLSDGRMTSIHPVVADLAKFVAIDPPRSFDTPAPPPPRVHGTPTSASPASRAFGRSSTTGFGSPMQPSSGGEAATVRGAGRGRLQLYMANNCLTKLPSALFEVGNLRVLSLRKNNLTVLPPAIGELQNLRELNVAGNRLQYLPAEIQKLTLDQFSFFPNPFLAPPQGSKLEVRSIYSITGGILAGEVEQQQQQQQQQGQQEDMDAVEASQEAEMEEAFLASPPEHAGGSMATQSAAVPMATPQAAPDPPGVMGPPALPARLLRGLGQAPQRPRDNGGQPAVPARPRTFDRTMSDAQVDDLLARGGGPMLTRPPRQSGLASAMGLPPPAPDTSTDPDDSMDSLMNGGGPGPRPPLPVPAKVPGPMQLMRVLGPLEVRQPRLASLRELCVRRLLSPVEVEAEAEASRPPSPVSKAEGAVAAPTGRSVAWSRVPSSSSAFQFQFHGGKRPTTVLDTYENGALRDVESKHQMETSTIALLESARRSIEGKWGSGSGHVGLTSRSTSSGSGASRGARSGAAAQGGENDSWCKGVTGTVKGDSSAPGADAGDQDDQMDADADDSSPEPSDGFDETVVSLSPCASRRSHAHAHVPAPSPVVDVSTMLDTDGDDSAANPHFNRCPNPCHAETHHLARAAGVKLGGGGAGSAGSGSGGPGAGTPMTPRSVSSSSAGFGVGSGAGRQHTGVTPTPSPAGVGCGSPSAAGSGALPPSLAHDYPFSPAECPYAPLFERPTETRMEWVSHIAGFKVLNLSSGALAAAGPSGPEARGSGVLPILWRGCGSGCLGFLEK